MTRGEKKMQKRYAKSPLQTLANEALQGVDFVTDETGKKIKEIRLWRGLTQKQLAEKCGLSEPTIRNYELGNRKPSLETIEIIADALEVTTFEIVLPELISRLEKIGFKLALSEDGEPIFRLHSNNKMLRELLLWHWMYR